LYVVADFATLQKLVLYLVGYFYSFQLIFSLILTGWLQSGEESLKAWYSHFLYATWRGECYV